MYHRIFCPVDGSETSNHGMREAIMLAKDQQAQLIFFNVVDFSPLTMYGPTFGTEFEAFREAGKGTLNRAIEEAKAQGCTAESRMAEIMTGGPGETLVREAKQCDADLIVMGTHGRRGLSRMLMGSDASIVLGQAHCPVLLVK